MAHEDRDQRSLRFARAIALASGVAIPLGATVPACADVQSPPVDAGIAQVDAGLTVDTGATEGIAVDAPPPGLRIDDVPGAEGDAGPADAAARDAPTLETTGGPMMPPEFDEALA